MQSAVGCQQGGGAAHWRGVCVLVEITDVTRDTRPAWGLFLVFL